VLSIFSGSFTRTYANKRKIKKTKAERFLNAVDTDDKRQAETILKISIFVIKMAMPYYPTRDITA